MTVTPESMMEFEPWAQRILGKSIMACNWDDLQAIRDAMFADAASQMAAADQAGMVLREVEKCGCPVLVADGDIARARPVHTCGAA